MSGKVYPENLLIFSNRQAAIKYLTNIVLKPVVVHKYQKFSKTFPTL